MSRSTSVFVLISALLIYWTNSTLSTHHLTSGGILPRPSIRVKEWLTNYNDGLEILRRESALALWNNLLDPGPFTAKRLEHDHANMAVWQRQKTAEAENLWRYWTETSDLLQTSETAEFSLEKRMFHLITRGPRYTAALARSLSSLVSRMREIYQDVSIEFQNTTYKTEGDFNHLMRTCQNPKTLQWVWNAWHNAVGQPIRPLFVQVVNVLNHAARLGGYQDMGSVWRAELELKEDVAVRTVVTKLFDQVAPLYALLHAHARHALRKKYGPDLVGIREPIPAHLLGDLWGQNWEALIDFIYPQPEESKDKEETELLTFSTRDLIKEANKIFREIGFPDLPKSFWSLSVLGISESPSNATCHSRALDMYAPDDYRLLFCERVSAAGLEAAFHELGHIHYFHAYSRQPTLFRDGANSAAHETMGDAIQLAAVAAVSQKTKKKRSGKKPDEMRYLFKTALKKLPLLAFARVVDEWRWDVLEGKITSTDYNRAWWLMKRRYQGVMSPSPRMEQFFDPGAKFHIPDNTPYIRYFIAVIAQFQVLKHLCQVSGYSTPLHLCNITKSRVAGKLLWVAMSRGSSIRWNELLKVLTGSPRLDATPLLEYFEPLNKWLLQEAERLNITVGW